MQGKPKIFLLIPTFQPNDAVGNDVAGMYRMLSEAGYDVSIHSEHIHASLASITKKIDPSASELWNDPRALMIYHHAIDWDLGEEVLAKSRNRIAVKYHNVTPPEFYRNYAQHYYWACLRGRQSTARIAKVPNILVWGDSEYNTREFAELGVPAERRRVVPPIHKIEDLAREPFDAVVLGAYRTPGIANLLFVGGMRPNKGHAKAVEVLAALRKKTDMRMRMLFVGNLDHNLAQYTHDIQAYIRNLDLDGDVFFAPSVTPSQLRAYYMTASVFLCVSEHEGFCVPLVEAMAFRVPVVAWATTAVGETAGDGAETIDNYDPEAIAASIARLLDDPERSRDLATRGRLRYEERFELPAIRRQLLSLVEEALHA